MHRAARILATTSQRICTALVFFRIFESGAVAPPALIQAKTRKIGKSSKPAAFLSLEQSASAPSRLADRCGVFRRSSTAPFARTCCWFQRNVVSERRRKVGRNPSSCLSRGAFLGPCPCPHGLRRQGQHDRIGGREGFIESFIQHFVERCQSSRPRLLDRFCFAFRNRHGGLPGNARTRKVTPCRPSLLL